MIDKLAISTIRQFGGTYGTAICLGDQRMESGARGGEFFKSLGFKEFIDIDYNGLGSLNCDLNYPLPHGISKADLLYDGGVIEHVANIGQALTTIIQLVAVGGVLIQRAPVNCYGDSYYNLDPMLYRDFYGANGFSELKLQLYYHKGLRGWIIAVADCWLPKAMNGSIRSALRPKRWFHDFMFRDKGVGLISMNRKHIWLRRRTHTLYVGIKRSEVEKITWPQQSIYPCSEINHQ